MQTMSSLPRRRTASVSSSLCEQSSGSRIHLLTVVTSPLRTNNWSDYGGMDVYVSQITGTQNHDFFYTNANVIVSGDFPATRAVRNELKQYTRRRSSPTSRPL